jgi:hypothetical protein
MKEKGRFYSTKSDRTMRVVAPRKFFVTRFVKGETLKEQMKTVVH